MIRSAIAVVIGVVTWVLAATLCNWALRAGVPGYAAAEPAMAFTLPMLVGRLAVGLVASLAAGVACGASAARSGRGPILAGSGADVPASALQAWTVFRAAPPAQRRGP